MWRTFKICLIVLILFSACSKPQQPDWNNPQDRPKPEIKRESAPDHEVEDFHLILLKLHNNERGMKGRSDFQLDPYLNAYAQKHAEWMAKKRNLKHSDVSDLMDKYHTAGENIAWNQRTEKEVVDSWMNSKGHRANIMNRSFTAIGFGMAQAADGSLYWCTVFGG